MGMTRPCSRCSGGTETCVVGNFYTCSVCDTPKPEPGPAKYEIKVTLTEKDLRATTQQRPVLAPRVWHTQGFLIKEGDAVTDIGPMRQEICPQCGCSKALRDTRFGNVVVCPTKSCMNREDELVFPVGARNGLRRRVLEAKPENAYDPRRAFFAVVDVS